MKYLALTLIMIIGIAPVRSQLTPSKKTQENADSPQESAKKLLRSIISGDTSVFQKYIPDVDLELKIYFGDSIPNVESEEIKQRIKGYEWNASSRAESLKFRFHRIHHELKALGLTSGASVDIVKAISYPPRTEPKPAGVPVLLFQALIHNPNNSYCIDLWGYMKTDAGWQLWEMNKMIDVAIKLYDNTGRVDLKKSGQYSIADNMRFNERDTTFIARYEDRWKPSASFIIEKGTQKMKITNINQFDSVSFQEGEFFCPSGANKNTLFRRITVGNNIFNVFNETNWEGVSATFKTEPLQKNDYLIFKKKYKSKINKDSSNVLWSDTTFSIRIRKTKYTFWSIWNHNSLAFGQGGNSYQGYITPLNLHIVQWGGDETSACFLVDSKRMIEYNFIPSLDRNASFSISPKNNFLLAYGNDINTDGNFIAILRIQWSSSGYSFEDFGGLLLDGPVINEIVWINESSFAIHKENETYLTVSFK